MRTCKVGISLVVAISLIIGSAFVNTNNLITQPNDVQFELQNNHVQSEDNVFIWETIGELDYLDPHVNYESDGDWIFYNVYETLYTYPWDSNVTDLTVPLLAASSPVLSADGLNYTIELREDITFHDGTPFNASCVKWNFERALKIFHLDGPAWMLAEFLKGGAAVEDAAYAYGTISSEFMLAFDTWIASSGAIEVIYDYTIRFVLAEPYPGFTSILAIPVSSILSPSYCINHASDPAWATWEAYGVDYGEFMNPMTILICGTGPYMLTEWVPGQSIELDIYNDYWRTSTSTGAGSIEKVYINVNHDYNDRSLNLRRNLIDGCYWPATSSLDIWSSETGESIYDNIFVSTGGYSYITNFAGFNMGGINLGTDAVPDWKVSPFQWLNFRKAASWAFDYDACISEALNGFGVQGRGPIPIGMFGHNGAYFDWEFDMSAAVAEWNLAMADSGFRDALNELENTLTFYYHIGDTVSEQIFLLLADGLTEMCSDPAADDFGLNADMEFTTQGLEIFDYREYTRERKMPIFSMWWFPDYADPDNYLFPYVYQRGTYAYRISYNNSVVNDLYLQQRIETNPNDRQDLLDLLQGEVADDVPYLWAYQQTEFRTWGTWLHGDGLIYNPMHDIYFYHVYKMNSPDPYSETTPQISHPDDIEMVVGTTGLNVTWIATDFFRDTFEISKDGVIIDSGDWTSYELNASLDGLTLGVHNFTLMVTNLGGNSASDSVIVTVVSDFNLTQTLVLVISIGSLGVIVVVIVLFVKRKRG